MNVPVEADGTLGIVDGLSAPGRSLTLRAERGHAGAGVELPADQQPLQRVRPDRGADGDLRPDAHTRSPMPQCPLIEVVRPGMLTTVQDWPGRIGYWHVGVPPSGPMDDLSLPARQPGARQSGRRRRTRMHEEAVRRCAFPDGGRVWRHRRASDRHAGRRAGARNGSRSADRRGRDAGRRARSPVPGMRCYVLVAGGLRSPSTSAAQPHSRLARSAVTAAGRCAKAMADGRRPTQDHSTAARRARRSTSSQASGTAGRSRSPKVRMPRRSSSPALTSTRLVGTDYTVHFNSDRTGVRLRRPEAAVGAQRRRRGRAASVEHSRQRLLRRHFGLHRRHPDPARP